MDVACSRCAACDPFACHRTGPEPLHHFVAIVTGAASGIGFAVTQCLAEREFAVAIADVRGAREAADKLTAKGLDAFGIELDVSAPDQVVRVLRQIEDRFGRVDVLVNNAGIYLSLEPKPFE